MAHAYVGFESRASEWWVSKRRNTAGVLTALLFAGLCVDYGGAIGLKYLAILLAVAWTMLRRSSAAILRRRWIDFVILIGLPAALAVFHLFRALLFDADFEAVTYLKRFYNTISTPALLLLFPLFYFAGTKATMRQVSIAFRVVSIFLILLFVLHASGMINLGDYSDLALKYQFGALGLDSRLPGSELAQRGQYSLRVAFSMPLIFGYEIATSVMGAVLVFIGFLIVGSRGLVLGALLVAALWFLRKEGLRRAAAWRVFVAVALATSLLLLSAPLRFRLTEVFLHRSAGILGGSDYTTLIRLGHLQGYYSLVATAPWKLFLGDGPTGHITNLVWQAILGYGDVSATEFSVLNIALYYGLPYAVLFVVWLFRAAWRLWRLRYHPDFTQADMGLLIGVAVFWITGNINPQMTAPFSIIAFMLLIVRHDELSMGEHAVGPRQAVKENANQA